MRLSFAFWNLGKQDLRTRIARLAAARAVDVLLLAECVIPPGDLLDALNRAADGAYCYPDCEGENVRLFTRLRKTQIIDKYNDDYVGMNIRQLKVGPRPGLLLVAVHYPSKMEWKKEGEHLQGAIKHLAPTIARFEDRFGHQRTVLVGDLNMNPFEDGVVSAFALHGVMTRALARREERDVAGKPYRFFYNPMWGCFGDRGSGPPGTYYYHGSGPGSYFWNVFDQVLVRPALMDGLAHLEVLQNDGAESLLTQNGLPSRASASDHLPLFFQLDL